MEWSEDLVTWTPIVTNVQGTGYETSVAIDPALLGKARGFFRLLVEDQ